LLMAVAGVYCVLSFAVSQRTHEFGIKMVLGANRAEIFRSVLLRGVKNIAIGLISGIALAEPAILLLNHLLATSPLPLHRFDATVFGISAILLAAVSRNSEKQKPEERRLVKGRKPGDKKPGDRKIISRTAATTTHPAQLGAIFCR
jgi:ABC-type antimicrobial peptide transport system permease subunit